MRPRKLKKQLSEVSLAVKELRSHVGETQQQFASRLGTAITTIARYETGREPNVRSLLALKDVATKAGRNDLADTFLKASAALLGPSSPANRAPWTLEAQDFQEWIFMRIAQEIARRPDVYGHMLQPFAALTLEVWRDIRAHDTAVVEALIQMKADLAAQRIEEQRGKQFEELFGEDPKPDERHDRKATKKKRRA